MTVAVVVGAGGGIGGACARALGGRYDAVLCVDLNQEAADATAAAIGPDAAGFQADVLSEDFAARVALRAAELGPVGCAVYAVAYEEHTPADQLSRESLVRSLTAGPVAAFDFFRALVPGPSASYVAIGSLHETRPFANCLGYNAAHGALGQVVRSLAHEWAGRGIRVNAVVPGWIATPGEEAFYGAEQLAAAAKQLPFGRHGRPSEIADAVAFLASEQAGYISGSFLTVDGGLGVSLARLQGV